MNAPMAEAMTGAASNSVDLWLDIRRWLLVVGGALFGIVSALAASKARIVVAAAFYHGRFAKGLGLAHCLVIVAAVAPGRLIFRGAWLPDTWHLSIRLPVVLLGFELPLMVVLPRLVLPFGYKGLVYQRLEVGKV